MKKILIIFACLLIALCGFAADRIYSQVSTRTSSGLVASGTGILGGVVVATDGTNAVTLNIYDNTDGSGKKIIPSTVITSSASNRVQAIAVDLQFNTGVYVTATSSGSFEYTVYYKTQ